MYREEATSLKDDYRRLLQQYADFQKKKDHFEEADARKFSRVWKMNQSEVSNLVDRIEHADQIITEQQLGLHYEPPQKGSNEGEQVETKRSAMDYARAVLSGADVSQSLADTVFRILCQECQFLVEEKLSVLLKPLEENERRLILIDAILSAINIDTEAEMKELIQTVVDSGVVNDDQTDPNLVYKVVLR